MLRTITAVGLMALGAGAQAQTCAPVGPDPLAGFAPLDALAYLDLPDPDFVRVTQTIEGVLFAPVVGQEGWGPAKRYCRIGLQEMIVDFDVPALDDSIAAEVTRAVYVWDSGGDPVGWRLDAMGERFRCARGDDPWAATCP